MRIHQIDPDEDTSLLTTGEHQVASSHYVADQMLEAHARSGAMEEKATWKSIDRKLRAPFALNQLDWICFGGKAGKSDKGYWCKPAAYVDARLCRLRLNEVVGPGYWQVRYEEMSRGLICYLELKCEGEWHSRSDVADWDSMADHGFKSTASGAFKRVCATWGIGEYLYSLPDLWAEHAAAKPDHKIGKKWYMGSFDKGKQRLWFTAPAANKIPPEFLGKQRPKSLKKPDYQYGAKIYSRLAVIGAKEIPPSAKEEEIMSIVTEINSDDSISEHTADMAANLCRAAFAVVHKEAKPF